MKKFLNVLIVVFVFFIFACDTSGSSDQGPTAPNMGSANDLPASNGVSPNQTQGITLCKDVVSAIDTGFNTNKVQSSSRTVQNMNSDYSWIESDGSVTMTCTTTQIASQDGSSEEKIQMSGSFQNRLVQGTEESYLVSGKITLDSSSKILFDVPGTRNDIPSIKITMNMKMSQKFGMAITAKGTTSGIGVKMIVSFYNSLDTGKIEIDMLQMLDPSTHVQLEQKLEEKLKITNADVAVYNDNNELIDTYQIPMKDFKMLDYL